MRIRHKIPTIFNLSMVDVLCCALGCVILLWLVNFREAKRRTQAAGETAAKLDEARRQLVDAEQHLLALRRERDLALAQAGLNAHQRDELRVQLVDAEARLAKKTEDARLVAANLAASEKDRTAVQQALAASEKEYATAQRTLRDQEAMVRTTTRTADALTARLREAEDQLARLRTAVERVPGLEKDLAGYRDKSIDAVKRLTLLEKELAAAQATADELRLDKKLLSQQASQARTDADDLRLDKKLLAQQVSQAKADAENRFAGIALTGRRVIFLVDMSGSMEFIDDRTPAPDKWLGVRETLGRIARSLPELEKYQVIAFARETTFLLGNEGRWIDFDRRTSVAQMTGALAVTKPKGATNMYIALEAAFRYRAQGLDTIYLLSDGLPNVGAGLTAEQEARLRETEKAEILGNYVRKALKTTWNRPAADKSRVRINTVGFFYESPDVGAFLWALARDNDGSFVGMSQP